MLLLAEWSTLVAALGGSAIGATAAMVGGYFTLRGTTLNVRYQEREAWRGRLIEASRDFHEAYMEAAVQVSKWVHKVEERSPKQMEGLEEAGARALRSGTLVELLFGPDSTAAAAAKDVTTQLSETIRRMHNLPDRADEQEVAIREMLQTMHKFDDAHEAFLRAVHIGVRPTSA